MLLSCVDLPSPRRVHAKRRGLVYFVPGNPGLVEYYADFLRCLRGLLDAAEAEAGPDATAYDVHGRNLLGFHDDEHPPFGPGNEPWDLEGQILGVYRQVAELSSDSSSSSSSSGSSGGAKSRRPYDVVLLMGHSVGSYIAVDVFHRHLRDPSAAPHLNLAHGLLLFPTLSHIARSPSGTRITAAIARAPSSLETHAHRLAALLLTLLPRHLLHLVARRVMGFSDRAAGVTAEWLKSRGGVWQAIHLGRSELRGIVEDRWERELWEASDSASETGAPRFFMFYGKDDHWVANHIRDEFIERRRKEDRQTRIAVDEGDLPHSFCVTEHTSLVIAQKVAAWIKEIEENR